MSKKTDEIIKKMNTQELLQNMVHDIDEIRSHVHFMALLILIQIAIVAVIAAGALVTGM